MAPWLAPAAGAERSAGPSLEPAVERIVRPLMAKDDIPGMAVALTVRGERHVFDFGVASRESGRKVDRATIFEIGSLSKTFTAALATYARQRGALALSDKAGDRLPALAGSAFDTVSLLDLGTFTAGGLPLQFPDAVADDETMIAYFRAWHPAYAPGTRRLYSNPSIGLFGRAAATALGGTFDDAMEKRLLPGLGLRQTFLHVPKGRMADYAVGYTKDDKPIRVAPGMFDAEAYGLKSTAADMLRFVEINLGERAVDPEIGAAVLATHAAYYDAGVMAQALGWEIVRRPVTLDRLLAANATDVIFNARPVRALVPPQPPAADDLVDKTGSTNGFGAYAAFVPGKKLGIVILANKNFPIPDRIRAAYALLDAASGL